MKKMYIITALLIFVVSCFSKEYEKEFHKSFPVTEGATLNLSAGNGDAEIIPWDKDEIKIDVYFKVNYSGIMVKTNIDFDVNFSYSGNTVVVEEVAGKSNVSGVIIFSSTDYRYIIHAPLYTKLLLKSRNGDLKINNWQGKEIISYTTNNGDIEFENISANLLKISTHNGDIDLKNINSDLKITAHNGDLYFTDCESKQVTLETYNGDMKLKKIKSSDVNIKTYNGDIYFELLADNSPDATIETYNGDLNLRVPEDLSAKFIYKTNNGDLKTRLDGKKNFESDRRKVSFDLNNGDGNISIKTYNGDVEIKKL